jgi:hypothetical protein
MALSNGDLLLMTFLDSVGRGMEMPDGCDAAALAGLGFIVGDTSTNGWLLTDEGTSCLERLRVRLNAADDQAGASRRSYSRLTTL